MSPNKKQDNDALLRADVLAFRQQLAKSRQKARELIQAGVIYLPERNIKPSTLLPCETVLLVRNEEADTVFVSRGAKKLLGACQQWKDFAHWVSGRVCLDVGASTGGFTEVLLRCGARKVYAVDVGVGQFDSDLAQDPRVHVYEGTDIRKLKKLPELAEVFVIDVSFISLRHVLPATARFLAPKARGVVLVKPQFEVGPRYVNDRGVADPAEVPAALEKLQEAITSFGYRIHRQIKAPITGKRAGNQEYLWLLEYA